MLALATIAVPAMASAQSDDPVKAFAGGYAGVEVGLHEHHFFIEQTDATGRRQGRYYRSWDLGGGGFAGYDHAVAPRVRLGGEVGISLGGGNPVAQLPTGTYSQHPQWGYRATARVGYLLGSRTLAYGSFGYGGHRYRIDNHAGVLDAHSWGSSFTIGAGVEHRLSDRAALRLDFRHLDNSMSHLLIGVPIRF
jgi:outer membrane immunogenic protein